MKTVGIVAEFNPFHNGHKYILNKAKEITGATCLVVVMSGDFVQRGECAVYDKYLRTKVALDNGADLVVMLPVNLSTASSEAFAEGGVRILEKLNVDYLAFGCEDASDVTINNMENISAFLLNEPAAYKEHLNSFLKSGETFPLARAHALKECFAINDEKLISSPNNILGIEYIKAILKNQCKIKPVAIRRTIDNYNSTSLSEFSSATAIRELIFKNEDIKNYLVESIYEVISKEDLFRMPMFINDFSAFFNYQLTQKLNNNISFIDYDYIDDKLSNRISNIYTGRCLLKDFSMELKTKNLTYSHISRALLRLMLDIKGFDTSCEYVRILGMTKNGAAHLSTIKKSIDVPIITKLSTGFEKIKHPWNIYFSNDVKASELYKEALFNKYNYSIKNDYQISPIINS